MQIYRRLLSGLLAASIFISKIPTIAVSAEDENPLRSASNAGNVQGIYRTGVGKGNGGKVYELPERLSLENWEGVPEVANVSYDTWDGTQESFDWFFDHKGTEDDPYIIDSAEDFMSMQRMWYEVKEYDPQYTVAATHYELPTDPIDIDYYKEYYRSQKYPENSNFFAIAKEDTEDFKSTGDINLISVFDSNNESGLDSHLTWTVKSAELSEPDVVVIGTDAITYQYYTSIIVEWSYNGVQWKEFDIVPYLLSYGEIDYITPVSRRAYYTKNEYDKAGEPAINRVGSSFTLPSTDIFSAEWDYESLTATITEKRTGETTTMYGVDYNISFFYNDVTLSHPIYSNPALAGVNLTMSVEQLFEDYVVYHASYIEDDNDRLTYNIKVVKTSDTHPIFYEDSAKLVSDDTDNSQNVCIFAASGEYYRGSPVNTLIDGYTASFSLTIPYSQWWTTSYRVTQGSGANAYNTSVYKDTSYSTTYDYCRYRLAGSLTRPVSHIWFTQNKDITPFDENPDYRYSALQSIRPIPDVVYDITYRLYKPDPQASRFCVDVTWVTHYVNSEEVLDSGEVIGVDITSKVGTAAYMAVSAVNDGSYRYNSSYYYKYQGNPYIEKAIDGTSVLYIPIKFRQNFTTATQDNTETTLAIPFVTLDQPSNDARDHLDRLYVNLTARVTSYDRLTAFSTLDDTWEFQCSSAKYTPTNHINIVYFNRLYRYAEDYFNSQFDSKKKYMEATGNGKQSYEKWEEEPFYVNKFFKLADNIDITAPKGFVNVTGNPYFKHDCIPSMVNCKWDLNGNIIKTEHGWTMLSADTSCRVTNGKIVGPFINDYKGTLSNLDIYSLSSLYSDAGNGSMYVGGTVTHCRLYGASTASTGSYPINISNSEIFIVSSTPWSTTSSITLFTSNAVVEDTTIIGSDNIIPSSLYLHGDYNNCIITGLRSKGIINVGSLYNCVIEAQLEGDWFGAYPSGSSRRGKCVDTYFKLKLTDPDYCLYSSTLTKEQYQNCTFDIELATTHNDSPLSLDYLAEYSGFKNCDITYWSSNPTLTLEFDYNGPFYQTDFADCNVHVDLNLGTRDASYSSYALLYYSGWHNSGLKVQQLTDMGLSCGYSSSSSYMIENSDFIIDKLAHTSEYGYNSSYMLTGSTPLNNCRVIVNDLTGYVHTLDVGGLKDTEVYITMSGALKPSPKVGNFYSGYSSVPCENSKVFVDFTEDAQGEVGPLFGSSVPVNGLLLYIEEMPDTVSIASPHLMIVQSNSNTWSNVNIIAPKLNVSTLKRFGLKSVFSLVSGRELPYNSMPYYTYSTEEEARVARADYLTTRRDQYAVSDICEFVVDGITKYGFYYNDNTRAYSGGSIQLAENIFVNVTIPDTTWVDTVSVFDYCTSMGFVDCTIELGGNADAAVVLNNNDWNYSSNSIMNGCILRSNTSNGFSGLYSSKYQQPLLFRNCYLDLPNAQVSDKSGNTFAQPGFSVRPAWLFDHDSNSIPLAYFSTTSVNGVQSIWEYGTPGAVYATYMGNVQFSKCYVPNNQSGFAHTYQTGVVSGADDFALGSYYSNVISKYTADRDALLSQGVDQSVVDSYTAAIATFEQLSAISNYRYYSMRDTTGLLSDYDKKYWEGVSVPEVLYVDLPDPGIDVKISSDWDTNGQLAYVLDNGDSVKFRTNSWTIMEPDTWLIHPITGEKLFELPVQTCLSSLGNGFLTFTDNANFGSIYKTTLVAAENGDVSIVGANGTAVTSGDVYSKAKSLLVSSVTPHTSDYVLAYATHKLGEGNTARIPSTKLTSTAYSNSTVDNGYTIEGYTQQGINTVITPIFKKKLSITIDIDGSENGTVTLPYDYTTEGEQLQLTYAVNPGYTLTDLKMNEDPLTSLSFFMPSEDIVITGKCVPFEGGIEEFYLMGSAGVINHLECRIDVTVPTSNYICNALPTIKYYGDYISPSDSARQDFSNASETPVTYTVHYGDNQTISYDVYVHQTPKTQKIYEFSLLGINGEVDNANNRIKVRVPSGTDLSNLKPDLISYSADAISADETVARDFGVPQMYTLTTAGMQARTYTVIAEEMSGTDAYIDEFKVSGIQGDIDEETKTITLNIPKMMNLTNIQPDYISYVGSSISPSKAAEVNLEDNATYTVQSLSGTSTTYDVKLNRSGDSEAVITEFKLAGIDGLIDETTKTIAVPVPVTTNITGITPDVLTFTGKSIYPVPTATQDFTQPVTYTVVAQDNTEVEYDIIIQPLTSEGKLLEFELQGYPGVIDEDAKTVTITDFPRELNLKDIVPSKFVTSPEATSDPDANTPQDFTKPVEYEVSSKYGDDVNTYTVNVVLEALNQDARIDRFVIDGHEATIDQINGMITLELPSTYKPADINSIVPEIEWVGETLNPDENDAQNFNQAITYTVTAEDPQIQREYDVVVTIEQVSEHDPYIIEAFSILGYAGLINQDTGAIDIHVPYSKAEDIKYTVPTIVWHADKITPADNRANDFSTQQTYTVTNKAGLAKSYYVNVHLDSSSGPVTPTQGNPSITRFELCGEQGVIDQAAATIKVTVFTSDSFDPSLDNVIPDGITFVGDSISPDVTESQDFTKPVSYTVTDEGITKTYQVIVEKRKPETGDPVPAEQCIINKFTLLGVDGTIDQTAKTIKFQFTEDKRNELKSAIPTIDWEGTTIIPNEGVALDFTTVRTYTVSTSTDSKTYTVTVDIGDGSDFNDEYPYITRFNLLGVNGNIDQDARTITFEFDWAYYEQLINTDATIIWRGDTITPDGATKMDYTTPKRFTVSKGDQSKTYTVTVTLTGTPPAGLDCSIDKFTLLGVDGTIDQTAKTIKFTFPESAKENLLNTVPVIEWTGSSISPKANAAQNFTVPISYTVKNIDATASKTYAVTVEFTPDTDDNDPNNICIIDKFTLCGYTGSINQTNGTIVVQLPTSKAEEIKSAVPSIVWRGETITPTESAAQDFSNPVKYRVTAKNTAKFKDYTVTVAFTGVDDACDINRFILCGIDGVIDRIDRTITVTVPYKEKANLSKAVPVIDWTGTKLTPDEKTAMNFNVPVKYTVSCEDSSLTKTYIVRVYVDEPDSDCSINSFALLGKSATVDQTTRTITLTLDKETFEDRIKNAVPTIGWSGESITPKDNAPQDFSKDIFYTVTAEDPDISKTYTVHVELDDQREPLITNFRLYSYAGYINQFTGVIKVKLPYSYKDKLSNAVPYIEWEGEKITPGDNVAQNFNDDVTYVVSVGDKEKSYAVQVEYDADTTCKITKFTLLGEKGRINQSSGNIYIDMPYDKSEDLANAVPEITWEGETLTPDERAAQNFNNDIVYTVTAENEDYSKQYTVIVQVEEPEEEDPEGEDPDEGDDDDGDEDEGDDDDGDEDEENPVPPAEDDYNPGTLPPPINKDDEDEEDEDTPNTGVGFNTGSLLGFLAASTAVAIFGKRYTKRKTKK